MTPVLRRLAPTRTELVDVGCIVALVLIALTSLRSSYGGVAFLVLGAIAAVLGATLAHVANRLGWRWFVSVGAAVAVYVVLASVLALRHHGFGGSIPSHRSALEALTSAVTGWKELITTAPPVGSTGDLLVLPVVSGFAAAFVSTFLARRFTTTAPAVIPPLIVLGLGIAVGTNEPVSILVNGAVMGVVALGWLSWREHRRRPLLEGVGVRARQLASGAMLLGVAAVAGFALSPVLPGAEASERDIWRQTVTPPFDPRQYTSPLSAYRDYVKPGYEADGTRKEADVVFTVDGLPEGVPVRLATMDAYDGLVWQVSAGDLDNPSLDDSGSFERVGASLAPEYDGELADVTVTIGAYRDVWVPDVGEVISLRFRGSAGGPERDRALAETFRYNRATDTGATTLRLREGDRYEMTVRLPVMLDELAGQPVDSDVPRIGQARSASEIAQQLATPDLLVENDTGRRLDRVRDLMSNTGAYSDGDQQANQIRAKAGHSAARMVEFVQDFPRSPLVGNAEQYASAYALLFRDLGNLPTRVVMGFVPSDPSLDGPVAVLATEVEAWVEVPVEGLGWVAVFPTPPRDQTALTITTPQQPEPDYRTQNPPPPPLVDPEFDQPAKASGDAKAPEEETAADEEAATPDGATAAEQLRSFLGRPAVIATGIAVSPVLLFALFAAAVLLLKRRRRARRRNRGAPHQRISNGWLEVTDLAVDMGRPVPAATTRREAAAFVGSSTVALADRTDAQVWGGSTLTDAEVDAYWQELAETLRSMRSELGRVDRIKASISLHSFSRARRSGRPGDR